MSLIVSFRILSKIMKIFLQHENYAKKYFRKYFNRFLIKKKKFLEYHLEL